ncbi:MAG: DUF2807 domain-containing protein [Dysgonamonadaceae bacterium]|nr:DUF2807 domain-containing protein [Dysgonamonadaceae bacterium]
MKILKSILLASVIMIISLSTSTAKNNELFSKNYKVKSFSSVKANTFADIVYTQSDEVVVKAVGEQNLVDNLKITVNKGVLTIENDKKLNNRNDVPVVIFLSSPTITSIETHGMGNWCLKGKVKTDNLEIKCKGIGSLRALDLQSEKVCVKYDGIGDLSLGGITNLVEITADGVGNVDCRNLLAKTAMVKSTKTGKVNCFASECIGLFNDGVGDITYHGNPTVKNLQNVGMGLIKEGM